MVFPVNNQGSPWGSGMQANSFMPFDPNMVNGMPGLFPPPVPLTMGVPGLYPDAAMGGMMPADPFAMGMQQTIDPMTGLPLNTGFGAPPIPNMPMGVDPFTGMPMPGFGNPSMMPPFAAPPMNNLMMDPFGGMPMAAPPMGNSFSTGGMFGAPAQASTQPASNPMKDMFSNLFKMMMIQKLFNRNNEQSAVDQASVAEDPEADTESESDGEVVDNATALDIIGDSKNFKSIAGGDGNISFLDLSRAARKSKDKDVKAAAEFIKSNPKLFKQLEKITKPGDGVFTEADLSKAMQMDSIIQGSADDTLHGGAGNDSLGEEEDTKITDNVSALDALSERFDEIEEAGAEGKGGKVDGHLTIAELSRAASTADDPQIKELAKYLRKSGLFTDLDELNSDEGVSQEDINSAYEDEAITSGDKDAADPGSKIDTTGVTEEGAIKTINTQFGLIDGLEDPKQKKRAGKSDNKLSKEDLDAVINSKDKNVTEEMKKAAKFIKDSGLLGKLDSSESDNTETANVNESSDGFVEKGTLKKWSDDYQTASRQGEGPKDIHKAMQLINDNIGLFAEGQDKLVSYNDLIRALNSSDKKFTPELKGALQYVKDHKSEFEQLDKADGADDDNLQVDVIGDAALGDVNDYGFNEANKSKEKNKEALNIVKEIWKDKLDIADGDTDDDDKVSEDDFKAAMADDSGQYTAKQKAAMKYIFEVQQKKGDSYSTLWEGMDGKDSIASWDDLQTALTKDLDPTSGDTENDDLD